MDIYTNNFYSDRMLGVVLFFSIPCGKHYKLRSYTKSRASHRADNFVVRTGLPRMHSGPTSRGDDDTRRYRGTRMILLACNAVNSAHILAGLRGHRHEISELAYHNNMAFKYQAILISNKSVRDRICIRFQNCSLPSQSLTQNRT